MINKRVNKHKEYVIDTVFHLREEIIELVLDSVKKGKQPDIEKIENKGKLIRKYHRRHRILSL